MNNIDKFKINVGKIISESIRLNRTFICEGEAINDVTIFNDIILVGEGASAIRVTLADGSSIIVAPWVKNYTVDGTMVVSTNIYKGVNYPSNKISYEVNYLVDKGAIKL